MPAESCGQEYTVHLRMSPHTKMFIGGHGVHANRMSMWTLTLEKVEELKKQQAEKQKELRILEATTLEQ